MKGNQDPLETYMAMSESERLSFLRTHLEDLEAVSEQVLIKALATESNFLIRWFAVKGLGIRQSESAVAYITQICREPEQDFGHTSLHSICAWSLGKIGISALSPVMSLLSSPNTESRRCAVDALGEIGSPLAIDALCTSLREDEYSVQLWAGLSLSKLGSQSLSCLHTMLKDGGTKLRLVALDSILKISSDESVEVLRQCLRSGSADEKKLILDKGARFHAKLAEELKLISASGDDPISYLAG